MRKALLNAAAALLVAAAALIVPAAQASAADSAAEGGVQLTAPKVANDPGWG